MRPHQLQPRQAQREAGCPLTLTPTTPRTVSCRPLCVGLSLRSCFRPPPPPPPSPAHTPAHPLPQAALRASTPLCTSAGCRCWTRWCAGLAALSSSAACCRHTSPRRRRLGTPPRRPHSQARRRRARLTIAALPLAGSCRPRVRAALTRPRCPLHPPRSTHPPRSRLMRLPPLRRCFLPPPCRRPLRPAAARRPPPRPPPTLLSAPCW